MYASHSSQCIWCVYVCQYHVMCHCYVIRTVRTSMSYCCQRPVTLTYVPQCLLVIVLSHMYVWRQVRPTIFSLKIRHSKSSPPARNLTKCILIAVEYPVFYCVLCVCVCVCVHTHMHKQHTHHMHTTHTHTHTHILYHTCTHTTCHTTHTPHMHKQEVMIAYNQVCVFHHAVGEIAFAFPETPASKWIHSYAKQDKEHRAY